ncbi:hypothetical protein AVEN_224816-1 [Araneus ventricosus]|uniref:Uncharacterized protein n=1 Tax=Araneus ventricosus TaxID=182803 RepID=A0A4Y2FXM9_ARAVE|nr:hypothetical protein AVEN_224816-1 [Araneus ventricosus]
MSQHPTFRAYSSPQALGKAVRKVKKSLPSSPRKKQAVVEKLASHVGLLIPSIKPQKKNGLRPHSGIGAVLKHHVWKKVLQGQTISKSAIEFFKVDAADINIKCLFVEEKEILLELSTIEEDFESINEQKGIQSSTV